MGELLLKVVPLGIGAAFTPSLLAMQILIVSGDPWRRRALAVIIGSGSAFGIVGVLSLLGFAQLPAPEPGADVIGGLLRLGAAAVLTGLCVYLFWPHPLLQKRVEAAITSRVARASAGVFLGMAFLLSIKDMSSFVMLVPALHDIAVSPTNIIERTVALVVLYGLALIGVLAPPAARLILGQRASGAMKGIYRFTMDYQFQIVGTVAAVMTVYLVISGLSQLR